MRIRKRYSIDRLFEGNKLVLMCVLFTANTMIQMILAEIIGIQFNLSSRAIIWQFVYVSAPVLPLAVFQHLWESGRIDENNYLLWTGISLHYVISCALTVLIVFIQSFFMPLPQGVYFAMIATYTTGYIIVLTGAVVIDLIQTSKINQKLQIIQASQKN